MLTRRHFLGAAALSVLSGYAAAQALTVKRPNILLVFPDQMRPQAMGFMGKESAITPRLDSFAKESHVFTQAASNYPVCSPFRAMLMTGAWPHVNTVITNCKVDTGSPGATPCELPAEMTCWSDVLHRNGYATGYIGKWHLDYPRTPFIPSANNRGKVKWNEWCPPERRHGFEYWYAYGTYDRHLNPMYWETDAPRDGFRYVKQWGPEHEADKAITYIENKNGRLRDPEKPFALVVSMNPPHTGYEEVPKRYLDLYKDKPLADFLKSPAIPPENSRWGRHYRHYIKMYLAAVTGVDEQFGRILDALKRQGLDDNTVVFFFSDHGDCLGMHGMVTKNNPYDESMLIPMLIRWPGKIRSEMDDALLNTVDLCPTILGLAGLEDQMPLQVQGKNLSGYLTGRPGTRPATAQPYMLIRGNAAEPRLADGVAQKENPDKTALLQIPSACIYGRRGIRDHRYTVVFEKFASDERLLAYCFDRESDPHQLVNCAAQIPQVVESRRKQLKGLLTEMKDPFALLL